MLNCSLTQKLVAFMAIVAICLPSSVFAAKGARTYGPTATAIGRVYELVMVTTWTGYTGNTWVINPSTDPYVPMTASGMWMPTPTGQVWGYIQHEHLWVPTITFSTGTSTGSCKQTGYYGTILWDPSTLTP